MRVANHVSVEDQIRKSLQRLKRPSKDSKHLKEELKELELKIKKFNADVQKLIASSPDRKKSKG
jgi:phage shock protein A